MELRRLSLYLALFVVAICSQSCSDAHSMHKRGADDVYDEDVLLGDEASDDETQNDEEGNDADEYIPERILTMSTGYNITRGMSVRLECKVQPNNSPVIQWLKDNQQIFLSKSPTKDNLSSRVHLSSDLNDHDLTITDIQPSDSGVYACRVLQQGPAALVEHNVHVVEAPRITEFTASDNGVLKEGSDLLLTCKVAGSPPPQVIWSFQKGSTTLSLVEANATFTLNTAFIKNIRRDQAGKYLCYAVNDIGHTESNISVTVLHKPRVFVHKTVVNSAVGTEAILYCSAHGDPKPRISWYKDGHLIDGSSNYNIATEGLNSNLTVIPREDADFGTFTCVAHNAHGKHNNSIELVERPVVERLAQDGNKLTWQVDSHQLLEQIELQLKNVKSEQEPTVVMVPVPEPAAGQHKFEMVHLLDDCEPGTYEAIVKAKNAKGWSVPSEPILLEYEAPMPIQTASVYHGDAHSIRPGSVVLSSIFMYLLMRLF